MEQVEIKLYKNAIVVGTEIATTAIFNGDVAINRELETDEMFYRNSIDGKFTFVNDVYDAIDLSTLDDKFYLEVYFSSTLVCTGVFTKTDCSFDEDNKICVVNSLRQFDKYTKLLEGIDNKYNLITLSPNADSVLMRKRAILQFYVQGDTKVTNVLGNMSYEVDAEETTNYNTLHDTYHFTVIKNYAYQSIDLGTYAYPLNSGVAYDVGGYYYQSEADENKWYRSDGEFYLGYLQVDQSTWHASLYNQNNEMMVKDPAATSNYYSVNSIGAALILRDYNDGGAMSTTILVDGATYRRVWARILSDNSNGGTAQTLPADDICDNNLNYRYCYTISNVAQLESRFINTPATSSTPTPYGKDEDGLYFEKPNPSTPTNNVIPIGWNMWIPESYWYESVIDMDLEEKDAYFTLRHAYEIKNCIELVAKQIDPTVNGVISTIIDSQSLISDIVYPAESKIYITPITNIKKTYYSTAAQRGDISLGDMLGMLKKCFKLYWYLDDSNNIRIEHVKYFLNGGTYTTPSNHEICDITAIKSMMVNKPWSYNTNKYDYDMSGLTKRYEFGWADASTEQFNGYPLEINNTYCEEASTEAVNVDNFISDVDFIMGSPNTLSDDIYVVMVAFTSYTPQRLDVNTYSIANNTTQYRMQNGEASFFYTANHSNLRLYDIDGNNVTTNGISKTINSIKRFRRQRDISFPIDLNKAFRNYVVTDYGSCQVLDIKISLESKTATANLIIP